MRLIILLTALCSTSAIALDEGRSQDAYCLKTDPQAAQNYALVVRKLDAQTYQLSHSSGPQNPYPFKDPFPAELRLLHVPEIREQVGDRLVPRFRTLVTVQSVAQNLSLDVIYVEGRQAVRGHLTRGSSSEQVICYNLDQLL